jgi:hypothetical protein
MAGFNANEAVFDIDEETQNFTAAYLGLISGQVGKLRMGQQTPSTPHANLLVMLTAGHNGFLAALIGSATERVLHQPRYPVLTLSA